MLALYFVESPISVLTFKASVYISWSIFLCNDNLICFPCSFEQSPLVETPFSPSCFTWQLHFYSLYSTDSHNLSPEWHRVLIWTLASCDSLLFWIRWFDFRIGFLEQQSALGQKAFTCLEQYIFPKDNKLVSIFLKYHVGITALFLFVSYAQLFAFDYGQQLAKFHKCPLFCFPRASSLLALWLYDNPRLSRHLPLPPPLDGWTIYDPVALLFEQCSEWQTK